MSESTKIEWCDSTFNPWIGCTKISTACDNCYAAVSTPSRIMGVEWGAGQPRRRTSEANWKLPLRWNEMAKQKRFIQCGNCGLREFRKLTRAGLACCSACNAMPESESAPVRPRVFCSSLADVFDNEVDPQWRADLFSLICRTPNLDWLLLTKRIGNALEMINQAINDTDAGIAMVSDWPWHNVWIGATICNQEEADRDIPKLLQVPARVRFLSVEPMLGVINLRHLNDGREVGEIDCLQPALWEDEIEGAWRDTSDTWEEDFEDWYGLDIEAAKGPMHKGLDWVICGGESGPDARPMHPDWVRSLRDQCADTGVPFLFKQWGEWRPPFKGEQYDTTFGRAQKTPCFIVETQGAVRCFQIPGVEDGAVMRMVGKKFAGNMLDSRQHLEWPISGKDLS